MIAVGGGDNDFVKGIHSFTRLDAHQKKTMQMHYELIKRIWMKLEVNKGIMLLLSVKNTHIIRYKPLEPACSHAFWIASTAIIFQHSVV